MSLSLIHYKLPFPSSLQPSISPNTHTKPFFSTHSKTLTSSLSLCLCLHPTPYSSTTPIFLPYLEEEEEEEDNEEEFKGEEEEEEIEEIEEVGAYDPDDPIYKFIKTRTLNSSKNPGKEGKLLLKKNRRATWHLSSDLEEEPEIDLKDNPLLVEENEKMELTLPKGIVAEILKLARNLPQNLTLEEALTQYEGKVSEKECLEILEMLGKEQLVVCCLYFFQWMRSQEPSLVTPRVFTVLFPLLGRAGMSDKLMVLFRNLPSGKEFRDVRVYNSAISGLLSCDRYAVLALSIWFACFSVFLFWLVSEQN